MTHETFRLHPDLTRYAHFYAKDRDDAAFIRGNQALIFKGYRNVVVDGVRLAYLEREAIGEEGATALHAPILLLHSLLATAETLAELIGELPMNRRIVALDMLSARPVDETKELDVHQASLAGLVRNFMSCVGLNQPVLIGHSHGGALALRIVAADPAALKALVLMSPAHPFGGYRSHVVNFYLRQPGRMLALSIPLAPSWMILRAYNEAAGSKRRILMRHLRPHLKILRHRNSLRRVLDILKTWDEDMEGLTMLLTREPISVPTLVIWGQEDPVVPISSAAELEEHFSECERSNLEGIGHLLPEEAPEETSRSIKEWLDRKVDGSGCSHS